MAAIEHFDTALFLLVNQGMHSAWLDPLMFFITTKPYVLLLPFVIAILIKDRKALLPLLAVSIISLALSDWIGFSLKELIGRPRPFSVLSDVFLVVGSSASPSMPSNHAANTFSFAVAFFMLTKDRLRYVLLGIAALVALSRVYVGVHYPSDVLVGAALGVLTASAVVGYYRWAAERVRREPATTWLITFIVMFSLFRIYYIMQGPTDLSADEAFYWEYSRRLGLSYYEKGPLIAYIIRLGTMLFGENAFGVRILSVLLAALSSLFVYLLGRDLVDKKTGAHAAALMQVVPLLNAQGIIMTIDSPLLMLWSLSLWLIYRATSSVRPGWWWLGLGAAVGAGILAKYTMVFFFACTLLYLLASKERRALLLTPWPYAALVVSIVVASPILIWNAAHGWATLKHTAGHANIQAGVEFSLSTFGNFMGSQFGVITPVLLVMMAVAVVRQRKSSGGSLVLWFSVPVAAFFLFKSFQGKVQANWAMPAYISPLILISVHYLRDFAREARIKQVAAVSGIALAVLITAVSYYPSVINLPPRLDPTEKLRGWSEMGQEVTKAVESMPGPTFVFSDRYMVTSQLSFYVKGKPRAYNVNFGRRMNQYDIWGGPDWPVGASAVFVKMVNVDAPVQLTEAFQRCEKDLLTITERGEKLRDYSIFRCYGYKGQIKQQGPEGF